jgi:hypothetical protein
MRISVTDLFFQLFLRGMGVSVAIHEAMHVFGASLIGLYAEYRSTNLFAVYREMITLTPLQHTIFYGSGGWFTGIIFLLFSLRNKDPENVLISRYVALSNFIYGTFESLGPRVFWDIGAMVGTLVGLASILVVIIWKKPDIVL